MIEVLWFVFYIFVTPIIITGIAVGLYAFYDMLNTIYDGTNLITTVVIAWVIVFSFGGMITLILIGLVSGG